MDTVLVSVDRGLNQWILWRVGRQRLASRPIPPIRTHQQTFFEVRDAAASNVWSSI